MTLKQTIYNILLNNPETRDSRVLLKWELMKEKGFVKSYIDRNELVMSKEDFIKWETDTVRRCSQDLQNLDSKDKYYSYEDKLLIQPSKKVKQMRDELAKQKGKPYIQGKQPVYNPETQTYEM